MSEIVRGHVSGNVRAPLHSWRGVLADYRSVAHVLSVTETQHPEVKRMLRTQVGWDALVRSCSIIWRMHEFKWLHEDSVVLSKSTWFTRKGHEQEPVTAEFVVLHPRGERYLYIPVVAHFPSHVEGFKGKVFRRVISGPANRVVAYVSAARGWRKLKRRLQAQYPNAVIDLCFDSNLDHKRRAVRRITQWMFGGYLNWRREARHEGWGSLHGTHGNRLIDVSRTYWLKGKLHVIVRNVHWRRRVSGFDHDGFMQRIEVSNVHASR